MAKVRLTRLTFASSFKNTESSKSAELMFVEAFTGKKIQELLKDVPDEEPIWVDTDKICAVSALKKVPVLDQTAFSIQFTHIGDDNDDKIWIKGEQYEDFIKVCAGKQQWLDVGVYKVGLDVPKAPGVVYVKPEVYATISEDGQTVTVKQVDYI